MFKKIVIDHCYNEDKNFAFFKRLEKLGFTLSDEKWEHPGKAFCRFIYLRSKRESERFYIEFVHIGKGGEEEKIPGLSFGYTEKLEKLSNKIAKKMPVHFFHKNYAWKTNSVDRLPGWNMLTFKKKPIKTVYTWFTEYEIDPAVKIKKRRKKTVHANSVYSLHGIKLILTPKSKANLELIMGKKLKAKTVMDNEVILYIEEGKKDRFDNIILNCKSFKKAKAHMKKCEEVVFDEMPAIHIKNNTQLEKVMWDLLIIEN